MPPNSPVETVRDLVAPLVDARGCRLYDVEVRGAGQHPSGSKGSGHEGSGRQGSGRQGSGRQGSGRPRTVRVLVDRDGGVDLDLITDLTRDISPALDDAPGFSGPYLLEVSSPGLERPLRRPAHFEAALGQTVTISYHTEAGPRRARGVLVEADAGHCVVDADGAREQIAYTAVTKARTVFEWGPTAHEPARKKSRARAKEST
jgi:ribosome maturation factor RimP